MHADFCAFYSMLRKTQPAIPLHARSKSVFKYRGDVLV